MHSDIVSGGIPQGVPTHHSHTHHELSHSLTPPQQHHINDTPNAHYADGHGYISAGEHHQLHTGLNYSYDVGGHGVNGAHAMPTGGLGTGDSPLSSVNASPTRYV